MNDALPRISPVLSRWFSWYARRYVRRRFHAVRLLRAAPIPSADTDPLIIVMNHPSWWDPMIALVLKERFFPDREHFAPMDAAALDKYRFFARLGFFGVEPGTSRGAARFLRVAEAVLSRPRTALWITAQGRFTDPRERPVALAAGVGHLAGRLRTGRIVPLAVEYPFWDERTPEALVALGEAIPVAEATERSAEAWTRRIETALAAAQDALAAAAVRRDASAFDTVLSGAAGVGGIYDLWRGLRARLRGKRFRAEHGDPGP